MTEGPGEATQPEHPRGLTRQGFDPDPEPAQGIPPPAPAFFLPAFDTTRGRCNRTAHRDQRSRSQPVMQ